MEIPMSSKEKKNRVGSLTMGAGQNKVETVLSIHHKLGIDARSSLIEWWEYNSLIKESVAPAHMDGGWDNQSCTWS